MNQTAGRLRFPPAGETADRRVQSPHQGRRLATALIAHPLGRDCTHFADHYPRWPPPACAAFDRRPRSSAFRSSSFRREGIAARACFRTASVGFAAGSCVGRRVVVRCSLRRRRFPCRGMTNAVCRALDGISRPGFAAAPLHFTPTPFQRFHTQRADAACRAAPDRIGRDTQSRRSNTDRANAATNSLPRRIRESKGPLIPSVSRFASTA